VHVRLCPISAPNPQLPTSNSSLVNAIKPKVRYEFLKTRNGFTFHVLQKELPEQKLYISQRSITIINLRILYWVALVSIPRHKLVRPPCCPYTLRGIRNSKLGKPHSGQLVATSNLCLSHLYSHTMLWVCTKPESLMDFDWTWRLQTVNDTPNAGRPNRGLCDLD
jgi:hypothetical protein